MTQDDRARLQATATIAAALVIETVMSPTEIATRATQIVDQIVAKLPREYSATLTTQPAFKAPKE